MKKLTNRQISDLQQILDDMHNDPHCDNGQGQWLNFVVWVRDIIQMAIDQRDGQIIIDAFADGNFQDFGACSVVSPKKPKKATAKATAKATVANTTPTTTTTTDTPTTTTTTANASTFIPKRRQAIARIKI